jgi:iron complex outermembrane receptor protein
VRVTKQLDQSDGFWGSAYNGSDFFTGLFSDADNGKPPLWIELGGQLSILGNSQQAYSPPFLADVTEPKQLKALEDQQPPLYGLDKEAKVTYEPVGSDWVFSASVRYGRSSANRNEHQQTPNADVKVLPFTVSTIDGFPLTHPIHAGGYSVYPSRHVKFADGLAQQSERHTILDFLVGKDVGLGMFGLDGTSILSGGIRVAQFVSKSNVNLNVIPDIHYPTAPIANHAQKYQFIHNKMHFHDYVGTAASKESFHGLGPELAWNASTPVAGNDTDNGEITLDWGANVSVLFGRQKARGSHQTVANSYYVTTAGGGGIAFVGQAFGTPNHRVIPQYFYGDCLHGGIVHFQTLGICKHTTNAASHNRSRMVAIPNVGALFGLSYKYQNAKISFGYRADEFFGAMDGGIDTHKSENRGFNGPYATISFGLGG